MNLTICEEVEVSQAIDLYHVKYKRFEDAWDGLKWLISRKPCLGVRIDTTDFFLYKQDGFLNLNIPTIIILYSFNDSKITIKSINASEFEDPLEEENFKTSLEDVSK